MRASSLPSSAYRFGDFTLDLQAGELRKQGVKLKIQGQPLEILAILLERRGQMVAREEFHKKLWPSDTFVDFEHGLNAAVRRLREALNDSAETPRYVETLARRGYRFIAAVEGCEQPQEVQIERRKPKYVLAGMLGLGLAVAVLAGLALHAMRERSKVAASRSQIQSVAVLPLANLSSDPEQEYFTDGMTEELITDLAQIGALRVISRTSVMQYKGTKKPLPEIARELHVEAVVVGSVAREGDRVRISVQLIHAPTDRHLWAKSYERDLHDVLALQSRVAQTIADEIQVKLTPQERAKLGSSRQVNPEAHEAYLKGLYFFNEGRDYLRTPKRAESLQKGIEYFKQASAIDPNYALAYSGLARSYHWLAGVLDPALNARQSRAAAEKALQIDDTVAEAHAALAYVMFRFEWNWSEAQREYKRAMELSPSYAEAHQGYAGYLAAVGKLDEAIAEIQRAIELDPLTLPQKMNAGGIYTCAGQYDRAIEEFRNLLELNPSSALAHLGLGEAYWDKGMHAEAVTEFRKSMDISGGTPKGSPFLPRAYPAYAAWEQRGDPTRLLDELKKLSKRESLSPASIAGVYAAVGDKDQAFSWLEKAYEERAVALTFIKCDLEFESLRSDPRFHNLLRRMGLPQ
jgi:TolB-like protein/DNA-binding winged helix-turn-helix (wHTH) protein/lipopolysaccharide biosynthesis regulator YciM